MPSEFQPIANPTLQAKLPEGVNWIHELKWDGFRFQLHVRNGQAQWWTRNGFDWTHKVGAMSVFASELSDCVLDGELVALDEHGQSDFSALTSALASGDTDDLTFMAFDCLWAGDHDMRPYALATRKKRLTAILDSAGHFIDDHIRAVDELPPGSGANLLKAACGLRLEGIVSKRLDESYRAGRTAVWIKTKCRPGQELVVGGWKSGADGRFKGLLTGVYEDGSLKYAGGVKTGFSDRAVTEAVPRLKALARGKSPFIGPQPTASIGDRLHFVEPNLIAEAEIAEWTASKRIRQASFKGWRSDKSPEDVRREG